MASPYLNPFFIGFGADQILYGFGCEYGIFRVSEMIRIWTGDGAEADFLSRIICAYILFFMMRNNSLTKVTKRQYNTK